MDFWLLRPWIVGYSHRGLLAIHTVGCWLLTPWAAGYLHRGLLATHIVDCWLLTSWIAGYSHRGLLATHTVGCWLFTRGLLTLHAMDSGSQRKEQHVFPSDYHSCRVGHMVATKSISFPFSAGELKYCTWGQRALGCNCVIV